MPNYEYHCLDCKKRFEQFFTFAEYETQSVQCTHCSSDKVRRKIGRVRLARSDESHMESLADPGNLDKIDEDPRALGQMMRQMSSQMGEDMGSEFNEVIKRLESGQSPESIESDMPDLGTNSDSGGFGDA